MKAIKYKNFDLEIYKVANEYIAKAHSFRGEAKQSFALPFALKEIEKFIEKIEDFISYRSTDFDIIKQFGGKLFDSVFRDDLRSVFKACTDYAEETEGIGLRIRLHLQEVPELAYLPWEYVYHASTNQFICLNKKTPIVRYLGIPKAIVPIKIDLPLQILVMIASPKNLDYLNYNSEKEKVEEALSDLLLKDLVKLTYLKTGTFYDLQDELMKSKYHVFHFIGHGIFDKETNTGCLAFETETKNTYLIKAEQLGATLINHGFIKLAVLNSCQGAKTSSKNPFVGTASTLVQQGIPAVVAMQFSISNPSAVQFSKIFYGAIAEGFPVDTAVTEARVSIYSGEENNVEWGTPVIFMRSPDGRLFDLGKNEREEKGTFNKSLFFIIGLITIFFIFFTHIVLFTVPKMNIVDMHIFAKTIKFSIPVENKSGKRIPLIQLPIRTDYVKIEKFQPKELFIDTTIMVSNRLKFKNPITFVPRSVSGRITFSSTRKNISIQEIMCDSASEVTFRKSANRLIIEVKRSAQNPILVLSLDDTIRIAGQECDVVDANQTFLTDKFYDPLSLILKGRSQPSNIMGQHGELYVNINDFPSGKSEPKILLQKQQVQDLFLFKNITQPEKITRESTIDSIIINRKFPSARVCYSKPKINEINMISVPNKFSILFLADVGNTFELHASGKKFSSLKAGLPGMEDELIPSYVSIVNQNNLLVIVALWLIWATIIGSLIRFKLIRNKNKTYAR